MKDKKINEVLEICKSYKIIQATINELDFKMQELSEETSPSAEKESEKKEELRIKQEAMCRKLNRIDNSLTVLTDDEREIIQTVHIQGRHYRIVQDKIHLSYPRIKQLEVKATEKMKDFIFGEI